MNCLWRWKCVTRMTVVRGDGNVVLGMELVPQNEMRQMNELASAIEMGT